VEIGGGPGRSARCFAGELNLANPLGRLLDERVLFLKGWFKDTLPIAPVERLAILRVDGDMYSSTMDSLLNLYPKLSVGGYAIIDDYGEIETCRRAVDDFRASNKIEAPLNPIDLSGVYWKKQA
jgi:O-methyltransferase